MGSHSHLPGYPHNIDQNFYPLNDETSIDRLENFGIRKGFSVLAFMHPTYLGHDSYPLLSETSVEGKDFQITMDEERLEEEKIYDGKWVLLTNTEYSSKECALYYKSLSQIEQGFRALKTEIETGPIYHWTTKRIRGHVFICFLALLLKIAFEKALEKIDSKAVYSEIIQALKDVKATKIRVKNRELILRTALPEKAHLGFKAAGIRIPGELLSLDQESLPADRQGVVPTSV